MADIVTTFSEQTEIGLVSLVAALVRYLKTSPEASEAAVEAASVPIDLRLPPDLITSLTPLLRDLSFEVDSDEAREDVADSTVYRFTVLKSPWQKQAVLCLNDARWHLDSKDARTEIRAFPHVFKSRIAKNERVVLFRIETIDRSLLNPFIENWVSWPWFQVVWQELNHLKQVPTKSDPIRSQDLQDLLLLRLKPRRLDEEQMEEWQLKIARVLARLKPYCDDPQGWQSLLKRAGLIEFRENQSGPVDRDEALKTLRRFAYLHPPSQLSRTAQQILLEMVRDEDLLAAPDKEIIVQFLLELSSSSNTA